jgi:hypothetical protein
VNPISSEKDLAPCTIRKNQQQQHHRWISAEGEFTDTFADKGLLAFHVWPEKAMLKRLI